MTDFLAVSLGVVVVYPSADTLTSHTTSVPIRFDKMRTLDVPQHWLPSKQKLTVMRMLSQMCQMCHPTRNLSLNAGKESPKHRQVRERRKKRYVPTLLMRFCESLRAS